jgi:transposase InsO family protein
MPMSERTIMSERIRFVHLASETGANVRALCRAFGISPTTGYRYLARFQAAGEAGLGDRSRRPHRSPAQTAAPVMAEILALREAHPVWGGRKLRRLLAQAGVEPVPAASTITAILHRHQLIDPIESAKHTPMQRFERATSNELWQMDFKGHIALADGARCHPLTVLDDHSRFALVVAACADEQGRTVQAQLIRAFHTYGTPDALLADNGSPWSAAGQPWTPLTVWLLQHDLPVLHGRPSHPQTQGKDERFHRTLKAEALTDQPFASLGIAQTAFDGFRNTYNTLRPHDALDLATPASRYTASRRVFPTVPPTIVYEPGTLVRKVQQKGEIWVHGKAYRVADAFYGHHVALSPLSTNEHHWAVQFGRHRVTIIDLTQPCG